MIAECSHCRFWRAARAAANEAGTRRGWCRFEPARIASLSTDWCGRFQSPFLASRFLGEGNNDAMVVKGRRLYREARDHLFPTGGVGE